MYIQHPCTKLGLLAPLYPFDQCSDFTRKVIGGGNILTNNYCFLLFAGGKHFNCNHLLVYKKDCTVVIQMWPWLAISWPCIIVAATSSMACIYFREQQNYSKVLEKLLVPSTTTTKTCGGPLTIIYTRPLLTCEQKGFRQIVTDIQRDVI